MTVPQIVTEFTKVVVALGDTNTVEVIDIEDPSVKCKDLEPVDFPVPADYGEQ
jgi:hypothetical protein